MAPTSVQRQCKVKASSLPMTHNLPDPSSYTRTTDLTHAGILLLLSTFDICFELHRRQALREIQSEYDGYGRKVDARHRRMLEHIDGVLGILEKMGWGGSEECSIVLQRVKLVRMASLGS